MIQTLTFVRSTITLPLQPEDLDEIGPAKSSAKPKPHQSTKTSMTVTEVKTIVTTRSYRRVR